MSFYHFNIVVITVKMAGGGQNFPEFWEPMPFMQLLKIVNLQSNTKEYVGIHEQFMSTMSTYQVQWIHRVQNKRLWEQYAGKKSTMSKTNGGLSNELYLFHGSRNFENICKSVDGFDMRFASEGMWGRANYFAETASYSHSYCFQDRASSCNVIIVAMVLTGISCKRNIDVTLRAPPSLPMNSALNERYDSVNGMAGNTKVHMTYSNDQAYPAYLICYKANAYGDVASSGATVQIYANPLLAASDTTDAECGAAIPSKHDLRTPLSGIPMTNPPGNSHPRNHVRRDESRPLISRQTRTSTHRKVTICMVCIYLTLSMLLLGTIIYLVVVIKFKVKF